jgi:hypothetical protein
MLWYGRKLHAETELTIRNALTQARFWKWLTISDGSWSFLSHQRTDSSAKKVRRSMQADRANQRCRHRQFWHAREHALP